MKAVQILNKTERHFIQVFRSQEKGMKGQLMDMWTNGQIMAINSREFVDKPGVPGWYTVEKSVVRKFIETDEWYKQIPKDWRQVIPKRKGYKVAEVVKEFGALKILREEDNRNPKDMIELRAGDTRCFTQYHYYRYLMDTFTYSGDGELTWKIKSPLEGVLCFVGDGILCGVIMPVDLMNYRKKMAQEEVKKEEMKNG